MLDNCDGPARCSLMKGTMNALFIKIFLSGTAARGYTCLVGYRGFPHSIPKMYVKYFFLNNSQVLCNEIGITKGHTEHMLEMY